MLNFIKFKYIALDISRKKKLFSLDTQHEIHPNIMILGLTIKEGNNIPSLGSFKSFDIPLLSY